MADNASLGAAKNAKNDEFYTQYSDIEAEMNVYVEFNPDVFRDKTILLPCDDPEWSNFTKYFAANFERFGLKKLISTSYAKGAANAQITMFELMSPLFDETKHEAHGKLFTLTRDADGSGSIDTDDIEFTGYLEGDGDFRSVEVTKLRDEADIIITNPPFSLFREFLGWIMDGRKQFIIIGNQNAITYKEVFPLLKDNRAWLGAPFPNGNAYFDVPEDADTSCYAAGVYDAETRRLHFRNCRWFTNVDFGGRHEELQLDTMAHNLKYNRKLKKKLETEYGALEYPHYDNYDAIEVPFTECIPSDYVPCWFSCPRAEECEWAAKNGVDGNAAAACENQRIYLSESVDIRAEIRDTQLSSAQLSSAQLSSLPDAKCNGIMGVPITFLDKFNPEQFYIVGLAAGNIRGLAGMPSRTGKDGPYINGKLRYGRIFVRRKE